MTGYTGIAWGKLEGKSARAICIVAIVMEKVRHIICCHLHSHDCKVSEYNWALTSLVIALLYSLCIHKIGLRICVHNFLSDLVTACNKSRQKTRVTNLLSKALQDNMHEMIVKN